MRLAVLVLTSSLFLLTGCKSQCRLLSEKLCDCAATTTEKTSCLSRAATLEGTYTPTEEQEATCEGLIDQCDCRLVETAAGKERCGQAFPANSN